MESLQPLVYGFGLVLFRTAGLVVVAPVLGAKVVPTRIRLALALTLAAALYAGAGAPAIEPPPSFLHLAGAVAQETFFGLCTGFAAFAVLEAAWAAGHVGGLGMGLGYGALIDPFNGASSTVLSQIFAVVALGVGVGIGLHREAILWLTRSLIEFPPGHPMGVGPLVSMVVTHALLGATLAIRLAYPILAAVTFGHVALGVVGRTAQQLNLSNVGFAVALLAGGGALYLVAPAAAEIAARQAIQVFTRS